MGNTFIQVVYVDETIKEIDRSTNYHEDDSFKKFEKIFGINIYEVTPFICRRTNLKKWCEQEGEKYQDKENFLYYEDFEGNEYDLAYAPERFFNQNIDRLKPYFKKQEELRKKILDDPEKYLDTDVHESQYKSFKTELLDGFANRIISDIINGIYIILEN